MEIHYATLANNVLSLYCVSKTHSLNSQFTRAAEGSATIESLKNA
jgi:hypothetical protein